MDDLRIIYPDPFADHTPNRCWEWYKIWQEYLAFHVEVIAQNLNVPIAHIERNAKDGGHQRWDTSLFDKEVDDVVAQIQESKQFTAILLKYQQGGRHIILDGHHRLAAFIKMGQVDIPAVMVTVTPIERHK